MRVGDRGDGILWDHGYVVEPRSNDNASERSLCGFDCMAGGLPNIVGADPEQEPDDRTISDTQALVHTEVPLT